MRRGTGEGCHRTAFKMPSHKSERSSSEAFRKKEERYSHRAPWISSTEEDKDVSRELLSKQIFILGLDTATPVAF